MNQSHTGQKEDAVKKRRDYLVATAKIESVSEICRMALVLFTIGTGLMILVDFGHFLPTWVVLIAGLLSAGLAVGAYQAMKRADALAMALPYVPPVAEQIAALPAEEILMRGSDKPPAAADELLRAAHTGLVGSARELLRPESGAE